MQSVASLRSGDGQQRAREHGEARQACAVAPCEREGRAEQLARCGAAVVRGASRRVRRLEVAAIWRNHRAACVFGSPNPNRFENAAIVRPLPE